MHDPTSTALADLLQKHPYPWKVSVAIYGPPGTAEAVNVAAETQTLALQLAHGGLAGT